MPGEFAFFDVTRVNPIAVDYLDKIVAGQTSNDGIMWVKNIGSSPITNVTVTITQVGSSDGHTMMKITGGVPIVGVPTDVSVSVVSGSINGPITRHYKVSGIGAGNGCTLPSAAVSVSLTSETEKGFRIIWSALSNALGYAIYASDDNGVTYKMIGTTVSSEFVDTTAVIPSDGACPVTQNQAFRPEVYATGPLVIGDLDPDAMRPIFYIADVPYGTTANGNTRKADLVFTGDTV